MSYGRVFAGQRYAVVGLGKAGVPAAVALAAMGAEVFAWDDGAGPRAAATGLTLLPPERISGAVDALVLSPGIPHALPKPHPAAVWALERGVPILTDAELLYRAVRAAGSKARFAGITGTNGKSTTTALLAHVLTVAGVPNAAGANLGPAALSLPLLPDHGVYVLEMSSYMLEQIVSLRFDVASMLNLSPDHLDRHGDMEGYAAAKRRIFARQDADCVAVVGVDDTATRAIAEELAARPAKLVRISGDTKPAAGKALPGRHNAQNAAAAAAMAEALGVSAAAIVDGISSFPGLPHRQAELGEVSGVRFINDSKATNADAAAHAMACYDRFVWIAGGVAKSGGIDALAPLFARVAKAYLIGRDAPAFAISLRAHGVANDVVETVEAAVPLAYDEAIRCGAEVVLFSPAAASFDQFENFEQRGDRFAACVANLIREAA